MYVKSPPIKQIIAILIKLLLLYDICSSDCKIPTKPEEPIPAPAVVLSNPNKYTNGATNAELIIVGNHITGFLTIFLKDRKSTRLNSSHVRISYAVFCLKKKKKKKKKQTKYKMKKLNKK